MCKIFSSLTFDEYGFQTRSVRLGGHVTSIRLEAMFWKVLEEIAVRESSSVGRFLSTLHDEILAYDRNPQNFTSLLRCACLKYLRQSVVANDSAPAIDEMKAAALASGGVRLSLAVGASRPD